MASNIRFTIDGEPVAQGRPRFGKGKVYDPEKSRNFKQYVKLVASQHKPEKPIEGQIQLMVEIYRSIPKSMPKYKRELIKDMKVRPVTKPDVDNYIKAIKDALNGVIWRDDSQVVTLVVSKWYSENPRVEVNVIELEG
ncbi:RusA family crossover junction endodeoxyribonuclease [Bacillus solitudinis]|uniref:RusA family crossover junction endodeoxyribonuclease n=1 Tax=Bacillus solitudinis TaxID=2014074 RepID=UPI000C246873|nr:RusA family crossover junction endodeoxyribonuclease [Bacillus solitudinis]